MPVKVVACSAKTTVPARMQKAAWRLESLVKRNELWQQESHIPCSRTPRTTQRRTATMSCSQKHCVRRWDVEYLCLSNAKLKTRDQMIIMIQQWQPQSAWGSQEGKSWHSRYTNFKTTRSTNLSMACQTPRVRLAEKDLSRAGSCHQKRTMALQLRSSSWHVDSRYTNIKMTQHRLGARLARTLQE